MTSARKSQRPAASVLLAVLLFAGPAAAADAPATAADLKTTLEAVDQLWFGKKSTAQVAMTVKTAHYERVLRLTYWVEGKDRTLVRIDAPPREKGTSTLKLGPDIYNYLPKIGRTVKVSAALRTGSWMGSHFTNDDLMKASRFADDFDATLVLATKDKDVLLWTVDLVPKAETAVTWSRIRMVLDQAKATPRSQEFFDEKGAKSRTVLFDDVKDLGGRVVPSLVRVTPVAPPGEYTELRYEAIDRAVTFDAEFFSLSRLKNQ